MMKKIFSLLCTSLAISTAQAELREEPPTLSLQEAAQKIAARSAEFCKPELDGDKSKGHFTNADILALAQPGELQKAWPEVTLERAHKAIATLAEREAIVCMDKRLAGLTSSHNGKPVTGAMFLLYNVVLLNPQPEADNPARAFAAQQLRLIDAGENNYSVIRAIEGQTGQIYHEGIKQFPPALRNLPFALTLTPGQLDQSDTWVNDDNVTNALSGPPPLNFRRVSVAPLRQGLRLAALTAR